MFLARTDAKRFGMLKIILTDLPMEKVKNILASFFFPFSPSPSLSKIFNSDNKTLISQKSVSHEPISDFPFFFLFFLFFGFLSPTFTYLPVIHDSIHETSQCLFQSLTLNLEFPLLSPHLAPPQTDFVIDSQLSKLAQSKRFMLEMNAQIKS